MSKPSLLAQVRRTVGRESVDNVVPIGGSSLTRALNSFDAPTKAPATQPETAVTQPAVQPEFEGALTAEQCAELDKMMLDAETLPARVAPVAAPSAAIAPTAAPVAAGPLTAAEGIALVNKTHAIGPYAGEVVILREGTDSVTGYPTIGPISQSSFRLEFATVKVEANTATGIRKMPIADIWLAAEGRREYPGGVVFDPENPGRPGCYNTWRGFGVTPKSGDAGPMIEHVYMLCHGVAAHAEWLLNWLAFTVQRPGTMPETAIVLRGGQGTGKGTLCRILALIWGPHGLHITQPKHLTGNFNAHLAATRHLFVDEGFWAGDKAGEGVLKGLVTEPTIAIERKCFDVTTTPNRLAIIVAANGIWVVPAGADERRYFVVDVSALRAQDHAYFAALHSWIECDGAAIFLDHLLTRDLSGFNVRAAPKTAALDRQKIEAMPALDRFILEALDTEAGMSGDDWTEAPHRVICDAASARFDNYCRRAAVRGTRADSRAIGRRFGEVFGCGPATMNRVGPGTRRGWTLPGLTDARRMGAKAFGLAHYVWGQA
jgi:hypothetical protein